MRLTGLDHYAKGLGITIPSRRWRWRCSTGWSGSSGGWHGDGDEVLTCAQGLAMDVAALNTAYPGLKRLARAAAGLATSIANNAAALVNYSGRWHAGERISAAFVASTVNRVVSRRFAKKQQMQ